MLAHKLTRAVEIETATGRRRLAFTHRVLLDIEELTGLNAMQVHLGKLSATLLRAVLFSVLREAGDTITLKEAGQMCRPGVVGPVREALVAAWIASMPEIEPEAAVDRDAEGVGTETEILTTTGAWARARFDLGLSDDDWLGMTPRMIQALTKRHLEATRQSELMLAILCAHTVNHGFRAPEKATSPRDYMIHPWPQISASQVTGETLLGVFGDISKIQ